MKTLLFINSPSRDNSKHFPYGPAILTSILKNNRIEYDVFDGNFYSFEDLNCLLDKNEYEFIAISGIITTYIYQKKAIKLIRKHYPKSIIISGGGLASAVGETLLKLIPELDICAIGEGEKSNLDILLNYKTNPEGIKGILYKKDNTIYANDLVENIQNLDEIPMPDYEGWNLNKYLEYKSKYLRTSDTYSRKIDILTSRGCAYQCDFCFNILGRKKVRFRSVDSVIKEMKYLIENYKINYFNFMDENFFINKKFVIDFADKIRALNFDIRFAISARADSIDSYILKIVRDIGCELIYLGCESGNEKTLCKMNKKCTVKDNFEAFIQICNEDIVPVPMFMIGYEQETVSDINETFSFIKKLVEYGKGIKDNSIRNKFLLGIKNILPIYYATPYPGSQLFQRNKDSLPDIENVLILISNKDASCLTFNVSNILDNKLIELHNKLEYYIENIQF